MSNSSEAQMASRLRAAGLRATRASLGLLHLLARRKRPQSVAALRKALRPSPAVTTVYRALERLVEAKLVARIDLQHGHAHYELLDTEDHHHLVCTSCDRVEDFTGCETQVVIEAVRKEHGFARVSQHTFELFGTCLRCQRTATG
jgi:Fur family ferric uptake transcriptional regulator